MSYNVLIVAHTEFGLIPIGTSAQKTFKDKRRVARAVKHLKEVFPADDVRFEVVGVMAIHEIIKMGNLAKGASANVVQLPSSGDDQRVEDTSGDEDLLSAPTTVQAGGSVLMPEVRDEDAEAEGLSEAGQPVQPVSPIVPVNEATPTRRERLPGETKGDLD